MIKNKVMPITGSLNETYNIITFPLEGMEKVAMAVASPDKEITISKDKLFNVTLREFQDNEKKSHKKCLMGKYVSKGKNITLMTKSDEEQPICWQPSKTLALKLQETEAIQLKDNVELYYGAYISLDDAVEGIITPLEKDLTANVWKKSKVLNVIPRASLIGDFDENQMSMLKE